MQEARITVVDRFYVPRIASSQAWQELHTQTDLGGGSTKRLDCEARADIEWWHVFAAGWNGTAMMGAGLGISCQVTITSDASGNWGCGAYSERQWYMLP